MAADLTDGLDVTSPFGTRRATSREQLVWYFSDWRPLPQHWRQKLRKRFARKVRGPFDVEFEGMKLRLYPSENYCDRVIFGRSDLPERAEHEALLPHLKPGMVFVDIGANVGSYSAFVGTRAEGLTLIGFEPHPRTYAKLIYNLEANKLPTNNILNCGVGADHETTKLWSDGGSNIGHTSMLKEGTANASVSVDVPVVPLLDVLNERNIDRLDILKIDIEGFEDRALAPFFDNAPDDLLPALLLIETAHQHLWERDLPSQLNNHDYAITFQTAENVLLKKG